MTTREPAGIRGLTGLAAGWTPCVVTSGLYTWSWPFGERMVASANACWPGFDSWQPSPSWYGVARPCALSGFAGTARVQFPEAAAAAAVWFRLMALPAPSTGTVAASARDAAAAAVSCFPLVLLPADTASYDGAYRKQNGNDDREPHPRPTGGAHALAVAEPLSNFMVSGGPMLPRHPATFLSRCYVLVTAAPGCSR